jgi:HAE1 family hydrophobic/amphiphilic exporter-1
VVIENIFRHKELGLKAAASAAVGTEEVQRAITAGTLTTIAVFGPIIYVEGVAGQLFAALSFAVAFSLLASLLVACTLLPAMASRWHSAATPPAETGIRAIWARPLNAFDRAFSRFAEWYERMLDRALQHRGRVVFGALLLMAISIPIAPRAPRSVLPEVDQVHSALGCAAARNADRSHAADDPTPRGDHQQRPGRGCHLLARRPAQRAAQLG